jgi:probable rRNA maturation factor
LKTKLSEAQFDAIQKAVLGKDYDLSLAFVSAACIKKLNRIYRGIDKPTDILSFPFSATAGEIYICKSVARTEAKKFGRTPDNFLLFLFIHGLVHLKGFDHSSTMERIESRYRKQFKI